MRFKALRELLCRYRQIWRAAYSIRRELSPPERACLPAALELQSAWLDSKLDALCAQALLDALDKHRFPELAADPDLASNAALQQKRAEIQRLALSQWQELQAKLATIDADSARKQAERGGVQEQVKKLEQTLPLIARRAADYKNLSEKKFIAQHGYLEKVQLRIEAERDLATQRQKLAVHTVGRGVTAAQAVKIETFNYTRYGLIDGKVQTASLDAIQDEKRGLIYAARVKLSRNNMNIEGKPVKLTPGMAVSVEIKTGQRRVIEYFLSPLIQYASEGLRER